MEKTFSATMGGDADTWVLLCDWRKPGDAPADDSPRGVVIYNPGPDLAHVYVEEHAPGGVVDGDDPGDTGDHPGVPVPAGGTYAPTLRHRIKRIWARSAGAQDVGGGADIF